ncbi:MAG: hypothetical protein AABX27_02115, partial [Nanoarchaeota archaeon]
MIEFHYNIPEGSLDSIINSIALHWCPILSTPEGKIAESILRKPRKELIEEKPGIRSVRMGWSNATIAGVGINAYPCNKFTREEHAELTAIRYAPPSKTVTDYYIMIYGWQAAGMGDYPLTIGIKDNNPGAYDGDAELRAFARMAKDIGFKDATEWLYELQDRGLCRNKFDPPINEEILNWKVRQDERITYDWQLMSEIQMIRFYWDFFGKAIQMQGYMPEKVIGKNFSFNQP